MKYVLGLDIGITSVGWAALNLDEERVEAMGVRAFNAAEQRKTGESLAKPRRDARTARRRLRRRAGRLSRLKDIFVTYGLIPESNIEESLLTRPGKLSPWQLRYEGLDRLLSGEELARALFHIVKRRGFKSNRKKVAGNKEDGKMLAGIKANAERMQERGYRTVGEMYWLDEQFLERKRNSEGSYLNTVDRESLRREINALFEAQRRLGSQFAGSDFENDLIEVFLWQMPFAKGDDIIKLIGECTFEQGELRAPRRSYTAEQASLFQRVNNQSILSRGDKEFFDDESRNKIIELAHKNSKVTYAQVRRLLNIPEDRQFAGLNYFHRPSKKADIQEATNCENSTFVELKGYHTLRKACEECGVWDEVSQDPQLMDEIACAATYYKTDSDIGEYLTDRGASDAVIKAALHCDFTGVADLSLVALRKIVPHLRSGDYYSDACDKAGYDHTAIYGGEKMYKLPPVPTDLIRNPVVLRALAQARKVVNAVIDRYGSPYRIHIELARDIRKSKKERREIENYQKDNQAARARAVERIKQEFGVDASGTDIIKWRLYSEQGGKCAYSQQPIETSRLFEPNYVEIDHVIPYSRSFDNSQSNRVLVLAGQNQNKRNRTPYEWFGSDENHWTSFESWVKATIKNKEKINKLLNVTFGESNEKEQKERNLNDTRYINREFTTYVRNNLLFADPEVKLPVLCVNGQMVARTRGLWGFEKVREEDDLHHAMDAAVIASMTPSFVQRITNHSKSIETQATVVDPKTNEKFEWNENKKPRLPLPWPTFREEVLEKLNEVFISRMPLRKVSGEMHEATIRSKRLYKTEKRSISKIPLTSLNERNLANLYDPEHNERLYAAIRGRMAAFDNDAKKAFAEPLYKPLKDGSPGPVVKSVKITETLTAGFEVRNGVAKNSSMAWIDVYRRQNKAGKWQYDIVPVYVHQVMKNNLPPEPAGHCHFIFRLQAYDLVKLVRKNKEPLVGYYRDYNRNDSTILLSCPNNNDKTRGSLGVKTAEVFEKYHVDVLGNYYPITKEVRRGLENHSDLESGEAEGPK